MLKRILESRQLLQQQGCCHLAALCRWDLSRDVFFPIDIFTSLSLARSCPLHSGERPPLPPPPLRVPPGCHGTDLGSNVLEARGVGCAPALASRPQNRLESLPPRHLCAAVAGVVRLWQG